VAAGGRAGLTGHGRDGRCHRPPDKTAREAAEAIIALSDRIAAEADPSFTPKEILALRHEGHRY
jgi:hypothetical protein